MLLFPLLALAAAAAPAGSLEDLLVEELELAVDTLADQRDPPYYIALAVDETTSWTLLGRAGTLARSDHDHARTLDVDLRVGSPELDNTRPLRGFSALDGDGRQLLRIPLDDGFALRHAVRREIDARFRDAAERIVVVRGNLRVKVEEEVTAPDFEPRQGLVDRQTVPALELEVASWEEHLAALSRRLESSPVVHDSTVQLLAERSVHTFVDTEGARLVHGRVHARVALHAASVAPDGDVVTTFFSRDVHDPSDLPELAELMDWADQAIGRLEALRVAPRGGPHSGPVLLEGRAAAVFFHEVLGHRLEGHRKKREDEGHTFGDHVGRAILPEWIDVVDDPTVARLAGEDLNGHYRYDDEGVAAEPAPLVERGRLVGFLTHRSPLPDFPTSNGHGRRSAGMWPLARMGNTIVSARRTVPRERLRQLLLAEVRRQGLTHGHIVEDIDGGFTLTGRVMPNAFNVRANTVWRVYADGRPDELVRGLDLVGTPHVAFGDLLAAGDDVQVFNGVCGAESGWVPVSGIAPSLLFRKLEFQLKEKGQERPPLLDKPVARPEDAS